MNTKRFIKSQLPVVFAILTLTAPLLGQVHFEYPAPRYPELMDVETAADLLDIARPIVTRENRAESGFLVGWGIKPGYRVLLAVDSEYDHRIIDALETAIREAGAKPDVLFLDYHSFHPSMKPAEGVRVSDKHGWLYCGEKSFLRTDPIVVGVAFLLFSWHGKQRARLGLPLPLTSRRFRVGWGRLKSISSTQRP